MQYDYSALWCWDTITHLPCVSSLSLGGDIKKMPFIANCQYLVNEMFSFRSETVWVRSPLPFYKLTVTGTIVFLSILVTAILGHWRSLSNRTVTMDLAKWYVFVCLCALVCVQAFVWILQNQLVECQDIFIPPTMMRPLWSISTYVYNMI